MTNMKDLNKIDLTRVKRLHKYAGKYVAVDTSNQIVGSGRTYRETVESLDKNKVDVALFLIPEADVVLAP